MSYHQCYSAALPSGQHHKSNQRPFNSNQPNMFATHERLERRNYSKHWVLSPSRLQDVEPSPSSIGNDIANECHYEIQGTRFSYISSVSRLPGCPFSRSIDTAPKYLETSGPICSPMNSTDTFFLTPASSGGHPDKNSRARDKSDLEETDRAAVTRIAGLPQIG